MFNDVAMCCGDVMFMLWVQCWILSCCLYVQWCRDVVFVLWVQCWILSCCLNVQ